MDCESSQFESVSAASLSVATGIYQHHLISQEQGGEGDGSQGGGEEGEGEGGREGEDEREKGKGGEVECGGRVCGRLDSVCADAEPTHGNDISGKQPSASPRMSTSEGLCTSKPFVIFMCKALMCTQYIYPLNGVLYCMYIHVWYSIV